MAEILTSSGRGFTRERFEKLNFVTNWMSVLCGLFFFCCWTGIFIFGECYLSNDNVISAETKVKIKPVLNFCPHLCVVSLSQSILPWFLLCTISTYFLLSVHPSASLSRARSVMLTVLLHIFLVSQGEFQLRNNSCGLSACTISSCIWTRCLP